VTISLYLNGNRLSKKSKGFCSFKSTDNGICGTAHSSESTLDPYIFLSPLQNPYLINKELFSEEIVATELGVLPAKRHPQVGFHIRLRTP